MQKVTAALLVFSFAVVARADWKVSSATSESTANQAVEHHHLVMSNESGAEATLELALFSAKNATLRIIDDANANSSLAATMQRENCIAGSNGGYFDPQYAPVGLLVSAGRVVAPLSKARLLSGVVSVTNGRVQIQRPSEFSLKTKPSSARQCGPFLLDRGKPIAGLNDTRSARRTFVATNGGDRVTIGYCSSVTLAQLAALLAIPELKIQRALNLDGGSSSGFWFAGEKGVFSVSEQKTVRDYLGIVAKP